MSLKRSIESALSQDYGHIDVLVSDNASTDETESVCRYYSLLDNRFRYIRQLTNLGPRRTLPRCSRTHWVSISCGSDDDWIDANYVSTCMRQLVSDSSTAVVSGYPRYYHQGEKVYDGKLFNLLDDKWWCRVIAYYSKVSDNGIFYGLMRTEQIRKIAIMNEIGGDWLLLANIGHGQSTHEFGGIGISRLRWSNGELSNDSRNM